MQNTMKKSDMQRLRGNQHRERLVVRPLRGRGGGGGEGGGGRDAGQR